MIRKFYELFNALNQEALKRADEDLHLIEEAQREVLDAWTDYMMSRAEHPTEEELAMYARCVAIVERF